MRIHENADIMLVFSMMSEGDRYRDASFKLFDAEVGHTLHQVIPHVYKSDHKSPAAFGPMVGQMALATEIYLKALVLASTGVRATGRGKDGHHLGKLFGQLAPDDQVHVGRYAMDSLGRKRTNGALAGIELPAADIDRILRDEGLAFVKWRYLFERSANEVEAEFRQVSFGGIMDGARRRLWDYLYEILPSARPRKPRMPITQVNGTCVFPTTVHWA